MPDDPIIQTWHLTKVFHKQKGLKDLFLHPFSPREKIVALQDVTLTVNRGEVFGLIGPNGAGKTTLIKILCTLILPTSGRASVNGYDLRYEIPIKRSVGLVTSEERSFYWRLTGRENLQFHSTLCGLSPAEFESRLAHLATSLDLSSCLDRRFDVCSSGMRQRLALARALLHDPAILFLDEPTKSLDPSAAGQIREIIRNLAHQQGRTIFLVTHNLEEAEELCDRIGIMHQGHLQAVDEIGRLRELVQPEEHLRIEVAGLPPEAIARLRELEGVKEIEESSTYTRMTTVLNIRLRDSRENLPALIRSLVDAGGSIQEVNIEKASLEEIFKQFTSHNPPVPQEIVESGSGEKIWQAEASSSPPGSTAFSSWINKLRKPLAFLQRDFRLQVSYRLSFILQLLGIFFTVASYYYIALLFGPATIPYLDDYGGDYFAFVLIGIAFMGYQSVASYSFSSTIRAGQMQGTLEAMLVTPTALSTILLSSSLWSFVFTSFRVLVYLLIGTWIFGVQLTKANLVSALVVQLLSILAFSSLGILSASFVLAFKQGDPVNFLFASISGLLGGVYYPIGVLPRPLQWIARLLPLTYTLHAMRQAVLQGRSLGALAPDLAALALFCVVFLPLSLLAFRYAVRKAKQEGSLAQY